MGLNSEWREEAVTDGGRESELSEFVFVAEWLDRPLELASDGLDEPPDEAGSDVKEGPLCLEEWLVCVPCFESINDPSV